jgi:hypothetical protein
MFSRTGRRSPSFAIDPAFSLTLDFQRLASSRTQGVQTFAHLYQTMCKHLRLIADQFLGEV